MTVLQGRIVQVRPVAIGNNRCQGTLCWPVIVQSAGLNSTMQRPGHKAAPLHLSREEINELPLRRYEGPIEVIRDKDSLNRALISLERETLLGFDTETRPAFRKGQQHPPALLQLAGSGKVVLFQLGEIGLPEALCALLANHRVVKAGVAIDFDLRQLQQLRPFQPKNCIDLAKTAKKAQIRNQGLRGLAAALLGFRISKSARTSNWGQATLSEQQLRYAATDAWIGRELYLHLQLRAPALLSPEI